MTSGANGDPVTIIMIEDDEGHARLIERNIRRAGVNNEIVGFSDGSSALAYLMGPDGTGVSNAKRAILVLLDLNLPVQDGWDLFEKLTSNNPLLPVIVITARPNQVFPALASGVGALMEKPLDLPKLLNIIRQLLEEPVEAQLARMTGRPAEFHYLPHRPEDKTRSIHNKGR